MGFFLSKFRFNFALYKPNFINNMYILSPIDNYLKTMTAKNPKSLKPYRFYGRYFAHQHRWQHHYQQAYY
jgi:hypothetical protein